MKAPPVDVDASKGDDLARENAKLRKINKVLMNRVERNMDLQGSEFTLFEHAILLEAKVRERTEALEQALADLRRSHRELAQAKADAERANASKTRFLAAASHDLLQPLNAARLFVATLAETNRDDQIHALIGNIDTTFASIEHLLTDLLDISKLDAGAQQVEIIEFPLAPLLESLKTEFQAIADRKSLGFHCPPTELYLHTDRQLLGRVLRNLISNAIRYTDKGRIAIEIGVVGDRARIDVIDTGRGIPKDGQSEIFEEFKQLDYSGSMRDRSHGLGLAIVKRILTLLDHPIELVSTIDHGSRFSITVPLGSEERGRTLCSPSCEGRDPIAGMAGTIVVIDNEEAIRAGMMALLESWGYQVLTAPYADEVINALEKLSLSPDLVIADYHLDQGRVGIEEIDRIRAHYKLTVPAMIITADRSPEVQDSIAGRDLRVLTKPIKPARLRTLMAYLMSA